MFDILHISNATVLKRKPRNLIDDLSTSVLGMGLEPPGYKPLFEPMLTTIRDTIWRHWATMSQLWLSETNGNIERNTTFLGFFIVSHLNALHYDKTLFALTLFSCLK